jgi:glycosyltransferase involved in cell wall biosynthesis
MTVLFGHPSGNPNSHHAALAHLEAGRLEAFCVPWMPSQFSIRLLGHFGVLRPLAQRLSRRRFPPLDVAPKLQGRIGEFLRLLTRAIGRSDERLSYQANDWLMQTMRRECRRAKVSAVHSYEDCSLWQFVEAKRRGKACIYDMPIGYYPAWEKIQPELGRRYASWLPAHGLSSTSYVRPEQKRQEMSLADLVLVPSVFVADTIQEYYPAKKVALAPYGVDTDTWMPATKHMPEDVITFLFVGQCSIRKGTPFLLDAWRAAGIKHAKLRLVGSWHLSAARQKSLPPQVEWIGPVSRDRLREYYRDASIFAFPTFFEGRALVIGEALASGLPVLTTRASGADDLIDNACGRLVPIGNLEALVECLRWFDKNRGQLAAMSRAARVQAERCNWGKYRRSVSEAVAPFV